MCRVDILSLFVILNRSFILCFKTRSEFAKVLDGILHLVDIFAFKVIYVQKIFDKRKVISQKTNNIMNLISREIFRLLESLKQVLDVQKEWSLSLPLPGVAGYEGRGNQIVCQFSHNSMKSRSGATSHQIFYHRGTF